MAKGTIKTEYTVWCGICGNWDRLSGGSKAQMVRAWKENGWRLTRLRGWLCASCAKSLDDGTPAQVDEGNGSGAICE